MNDTALFLAIGAGSLAGILYGQQLSEHVLARIVAGSARRVRELRCVFCCGRIGSLCTALPTFFLAFLLPRHLNLASPGLSGMMEPTAVVGIGLVTAALLAASLALGATLGAITGKGIASITRDANPADRPI